MKATDLRIGNYVKSGDSNIFQITEIKKDRVSGINNDCIFGRLHQHLEPIPLTKQWLIDLGFKKINRSFLLELGEVIYHFDFHFNELLFPIGLSHGKRFISCRFVHKLQNLVYECFDSELIKKDGNTNKQTAPQD